MKATQNRRRPSAPRPRVERGAVQQFDEAVGDLAPAVPALVDNHGGAVALAIELAEEIGLAVDTRVGNVDIRNLTIGFFGDIRTVVLDPFSIAKLHFLAKTDRLHDNVPRRMVGLAVLLALHPLRVWHVGDRKNDGGAR